VLKTSFTEASDSKKRKEKEFPGFLEKTVVPERTFIILYRSTQIRPEGASLPCLRTQRGSPYEVVKKI